MRVVIQLQEYAENLRLSKEEWDDQVMQEMLNTATLATVYSNDVLSFQKEYNDQKGDLHLMANVVSATVVEKGFTIEEALEKIMKEATDYELRTEQLIQHLENKHDVSEDMKRFLIGVGYNIGGTWYIGKTNERYYNTFI